MLTPRVLFLCTANSARSQIAEALLRKHAGAYFESYSAGIEPSEINPLAVRVLSEIGIDASGQWAKSVEFFRGKMHFDYVITVCSSAEQRCPFFPATTARLHWPFDDPALATGSEEERLATFRRVRDEIEQKILFWIGTFGLERHGSKVNVN
jgi:arsenate reductase (thioredoxin)